MGTYEIIKNIHILTAVLSIALFLYRAKLQLQGNVIPRVLKILPHVNDTLLFVLGIILLYLAGLNVLHLSWLQIKFVLILVYILFGMYSFKWATSQQQQKIGIVMAAITFVAIVLVAIKKQTTF